MDSHSVIFFAVAAHEGGGHVGKGQIAGGAAQLFAAGARATLNLQMPALHHWQPPEVAGCAKLHMASHDVSYVTPSLPQTSGPVPHPQSVVFTPIDPQGITRVWPGERMEGELSRQREMELSMQREGALTVPAQLLEYWAAMEERVSPSLTVRKRKVMSWPQSRTISAEGLLSMHTGVPTLR